MKFVLFTLALIAPFVLGIDLVKSVFKELLTKPAFLYAISDFSDSVATESNTLLEPLERFIDGQIIDYEIRQFAWIDYERGHIVKVAFNGDPISMSFEFDQSSNTLTIYYDEEANDPGLTRTRAYTIH